MTLDRSRWSGRRRLGSDVQVLIGVGALLALLAVAVGVAAFLIVSLEDDAKDVSDRHVEYATAIHEAALYAKSIANHQRGFLLSGDGEFLEEIDAESVAARAAFATAASHAVGAAQRDRVEEARAGFERWMPEMLGDIETYRAGSRKRAIKDSLGPTRELRKKYEQSLQDAYAVGTSSIDSANDDLSASASRGVTILLAYLAFALVVGVAVALWVVRVILRPAFVLSRNAIEVLTRGRLLVEGDPEGSHHGVAVEVPIEVVDALAESALEAREGLRGGRSPAR